MKRLALAPARFLLRQITVAIRMLPQASLSQIPCGFVNVFLPHVEIELNCEPFTAFR